MFHTIKRILDIAGDQKKYIYAGIVCNILKTFSMAMMLMAVYVVISHLDSLTAEVIGQGLGILIASVFGRFLFQWLEDISMSAKGFDIFRDYRLAIGEKMKSAPMGYFSDQRLGTIQTTLTSTVVELEQYSMLFITDITGGVSMSVIIIVMMLFFSPWFSLLSLAGLLVGLYVLGMVQKAAAEHTPKVQEAQEELVTQSLEYIRGIAVLRSFSQTVGQDGRSVSVLPPAAEGGAGSGEGSPARPAALYSGVQAHRLRPHVPVHLPLPAGGHLPDLLLFVPGGVLYPLLRDGGHGGRLLPGQEDRHRAGPAGGGDQHPLPGPDGQGPRSRPLRHRAEGCILLLWRRPEGHRPCFSQNPPGDYLRRGGTVRLWKDHLMQPDRPFLGCAGGKCLRGRHGCEGLHRRQPAEKPLHGLPKCVSLPRLH